MKLLFENWRRFLKKQKSGVSKQNLEFLLKKMYEDNRWSDSDSLYGLLVDSGSSYYKSLFPPNVHAMWNGEEPYDFKVIADAREGARLLYIANIVEQVPQLKQNKIKRILGIGTMGVVFELDNGRALKLYRRGYVDDQEDFYDNEAGKIFSGQGRIMTLPIFDRGKTSPEIGLNYVEMAKVLPFNKFLERTGRTGRASMDDWKKVFLMAKTRLELKSITPAVARHVKYYYYRDSNTGELRKRDGGTRGKTANEWYVFYEDLVRNELLKDTLGLTDAEIKSFFDMINYAVDNYGLEYLEDLWGANFGVLEQTMSSKNPVFVLFDP